MTNEEILQSHAPGWLLKLPSEATQDFKEAMDEARKDEAIAFVKGISEFIECKAGWLKKFENPDEKEKFYTIEQLYELFKQKENE